MGNQLPPKKTGFKVVDAVLYCFFYLYNTARADIYAFTLIAFTLISITGWGLFVKQSTTTTKEIVLARKDERDNCNTEKVVLRQDIDTLKKQLLKLEIEYKLSEKMANKSITELYERIIIKK